jgi:hypothetical protein
VAPFQTRVALCQEHDVVAQGGDNWRGRHKTEKAAVKVGDGLICGVLRRRRVDLPDKVSAVWG